MDSSPSVEAAFLAYRCTREPAALAQVYDNASPRLLSVAMHLTRSPATAEDVVQDTFLVALENPDRWDETKPLMPWLLGILSNRVRQVDGLSRRAIDPARLLVPDATDPQEDYQATELLAHVDDAITHLAQPYRSVVLLRLRNGLSPADISIALGRNPNTVRTQLARGIEMLRKVLPSSVAVLLAGNLAASTGLATSRQVVMQRAVAIQSQLRAAYRTAFLHKVAVAVSIAVAMGVLAWSLLPADSATPLPAESVAQHRSQDLVAAQAAPLPDAAAAIPSHLTERHESSPLGSAAVTVLVRGSGVPFAMVELEPLGDRPRLLVHHYSYPHRNWRSIEPAKPLARDRWRSGFTAVDGHCKFDNLTPGYWICRTLGIAEVFEVGAGKASSLRMVAPANTTIVQGVVLDADGLQIAAAPIWKLNRNVQTSSVVVTHSDEYGRFSAAVPPRATLGVFHPGFAPVAVTVSATEWSPQRHVVLQFEEPGASVAGRVLDAVGQPRAGVVVEVGQVGDLGVAWANKEPQVLARVHRTTTDVDGRYCFESLVPGRTVLRARSEHHGVVQRPVDLVAEQRSACDLRLPAESILTGQMRNAAGAPAAGVIVRIGERQAFGLCSTVTDTDGRYRLSGISPGRCTVVASNLRGEFACRDLRVTAGDRLVWDVQLLAENLTVVGRVVDARGEPFAGGWLVHHRGQSYDVCQLGPDARFSVPINEREAQAPGSLQVYGRDPRSERGNLVGDVLAVLPQVRANSKLHEICVADRVANCSLRGRLVMAAGGAVEGECLLIGTRDRRTWRVGLDLQSDGSFVAGGLEAGTYRIRIEAAHRRSFGPIELPPRRSRDLGVIRVAQEALASPEHLRRFSFLFPDRVSGSDAVTVEVHDGHGWIINRKMQAASVHGAPSVSMMLPAGEHLIRATSSSGLVAVRKLIIDPNERPRRAVMLEFEHP